MSQAGIHIENLSVTYPNGKQALCDANVSLKSSSITALVGMNGAGKSTLFKTIMGFLPAKTGHITIESMPLSYARKKQLVAYMPQSEDVDWQFPVSVKVESFRVSESRRPAWGEIFLSLGLF